MINRKFINVYFIDGMSDQRKKRDITVSFNKDDPLYNKCKKLGSTEIKRIIGINTYKILKKISQKENRSLGNCIKYRLKKAVNHK